MSTTNQLFPPFKEWLKASLETSGISPTDQEIEFLTKNEILSKIYFDVRLEKKRMSKRLHAAESEHL